MLPVAPAVRRTFIAGVPSQARWYAAYRLAGPAGFATAGSCSA